MVATYEDQLAIVRGLKASATEKDRYVSWCVESGVVGVAKTPKGQIELFLQGAQLEPRFRRVREALEYQRWFRTGGDELLANRILLPAAGHFEQVAAFLCTELLRNGAAENLAKAFSRTEPLIELAIEDLTLADESLLGLCGEMLVLQSLLKEAAEERVAEVVSSWKGHAETPRDFQLGEIGIEVKTTTRMASSHLFSGLHQLEVGHSADGGDEYAYFVLSVGLEWSEGDNTTSLPEIIDGVTNRLERALGPSAQVFIAELLLHIKSYGLTLLGYDHKTMSKSARFARRFRLGFVRRYDFTDPAIRLLTTDDMNARPFVNINSLKLRINLPDQVSGDVNPRVGLANCTRGLVL